MFYHFDECHALCNILTSKEVNIRMAECVTSLKYSIFHTVKNLLICCSLPNHTNASGLNA